MTIILTVIHIFVCLFLIAVVLLQSGKGAEMGAAFGGSSQTIFGSRGAASFLGKMTTVVAIVFMITSLLLAIMSTRGSSVIQKTIPQQEQTTTPASAPPQIPTQQIPQSQQQSPPQTPQQAPSR